MEKFKISLEVAEQEWRNFLSENDALTLLPDESMKDGDKDEKNSYNASKSNLEKIVRAIAKGLVVIDGSVIKQTLQYPVKDTEGNLIKEGQLVFDQRWTAKDREEIYKGLNPEKAEDAMKIQRNLCAKITGWYPEILLKLDSKDLKVTDQIVAVFFM
jgi:hypothetical protein